MEILQKEKKKTENVFYLANIIIVLIMALFVYIVFRPDTYISKYLLGITRLKLLSMYMSEKNNIFIFFARYFMCDFLWAYAFTFSMQMFVRANNKNEYVRLIMYCLLFEILAEGMQKLHLISGTFDFYDIVFEGAATLVALFCIIIKMGEKDEKNQN